MRRLDYRRLIFFYPHDKYFFWLNDLHSIYNVYTLSSWVWKLISFFCISCWWCSCNNNLFTVFVSCSFRKSWLMKSSANIFGSLSLWYISALVLQLLVFHVPFLLQCPKHTSLLSDVVSASSYCVISSFVCFKNSKYFPQPTYSHWHNCFSFVFFAYASTFRYIQ